MAAIVSVTISSDRMSAILNALSGPREAWTQKEVVAEIERRGVTHGIVTRAVASAIEAARTGSFPSEGVVVARGTPPIMRSREAFEPAALDKLVAAETVIGRLLPPVAGKVGCTVTGDPMPIRQVPPLLVQSDATVRWNWKAKTYHSRHAGYPVLAGTKLSVEPCLRISADEMEATLTLRPSDLPETGAVADLLKKGGVAYGIEPAWIDELRDRCRQSGQPESAVVARAKAPTPGCSASVDFTAASTLVARGDGVAQLKPAEPGQPGTTVTGKKIPVPAVPAFKIETDETVGTSRDGLTFTSAVAGYPVLKDGRLTVEPCVRISEDQMEATLKLRPVDLPDADALEEILKNGGVAFGIEPDPIEQLRERVLKSGRVETAVVARGKAPAPGRPKTFTFKFATGARRTLVAPGDKLASTTPEEPGEAGMTVTGKAIPPPAIPEAKLNAGETVRTSKDGMTFTSAVAGYPSLEGRRLGVDPFLTLLDEAMTASIALYPWPQDTPLTAGRVAKVVEAAGCGIGVDRDAIEQLLRDVAESGRPRSATVARGLSSIQSQDARIEFPWDTALKAGAEMADGRTDYRTRQFVPRVHAGDVVAVKIPAVEGRDGRTVTGEVRPVPPAQDVKLAAAENVRLSPDGLRYLSEIAGLVIVDEQQVRVLNSMEIDGDVDFHGGNVNCDVCVIVKGSVRSGFSVRAEGHIIVKEAVEDAVIETNASLEVEGGIFHGPHGRVEAKGSVRARVAQNAAIRSGGKIVLTKGAIQSVLQARDEVTVVEAGAAIVGGTTIAGRRIVAPVVGSQMGVSTVLRVGADFRVLERLQKKHERIDEAMAQIRSTLGDRLEQQLEKRDVNLEETAVLKRLGSKLAAIVEHWRGLSRERKELAKELEAILTGHEAASEGPAEIRILQTVHPNVRLIVRDRTLLVKEMLPGGVFKLDPQNANITRYAI